MSDLLKKLSLGSLMLVTVFTLSFGSYVPKASAALATGDLVKGPNGDAVYYINGTQKHVFPDKKTYMSWYTNFNAVKKVTVAELDMYTTGAPVAYRPGTKLVTHPNTARIYAVEPGANLRWIPDEATAKALYGNDWAKRVNDMHELTFGNYTVGSELTSSAPAKGTVLRKTGDTTIYYYDGTNIRPFANAAAFEANKLNADFIVSVPSIASWTVGSSITGAEDFATISGVGTGTTIPTGPAGTLTVALSPTTPAANQVLLGGAARVPMVAVDVTAGSTAVVVDQLTIERKGIASDAAFTSFDLLNSETMMPLNNTSKSLNSTHSAVFNDDFTVPANTKMTIWVAANMASSLTSYAGEYPAIAVTAMTLKNSSVLAGTLPIVGNVMLTNGTITVGTATIIAGSNNPSAVTKEIGTKDYIVSSLKVTNNSTETAQTLRVKAVTFTNNGSTSIGDVENLRLVNTNTGTVIATIAAPTDKKVTFNNLNVDILKGNNLNLDLKLDIKSGSARTISYDVDKQADVVVLDTLRGFNVLPTYTGVSSSPYYPAPDTYVGNGKLRIESVAVTPVNVSENKNGVLLGKFKFVAQGEPIDITAIGLNLGLTTTTASVARYNDFTNLVLRDPAGLTVAGPKDPTLNAGNTTAGAIEWATATTTDTITVPVGETVYSVYGDLSSDFTANDKVQLGIYAKGITAKGSYSGNTITADPSGNTQSTILTIKSASLAVSLASTPISQTLVAGSQNVEVANVILDASSSGSDVRVTSFLVPIKTTANAYPDILTSIKIYVGGVEVPVDSSSLACATSCSTAADRGTTTLTISAGNLTIPAGGTKTVVVKGNVGTGATSGTFKVGAQGGSVVAIDSEAQTFSPSTTGNDGATMNLSAGGTLNISNSTDPRAALVVGGTTVTVAKFTAQAVQDTMNMKAFGIAVGSPDGGFSASTVSDTVSSLELWEEGGTSALGTVTVNSATATITPATPVSLTRDTQKVYLIKAKFADVNYLSSSAISGSGMDITLTNVDVTGASAGSSSVTVNGTNTAFNTFSNFKAVPTVALVTLPSTVISGNGVQDLFKFSITSGSAGPVGLAKVAFGISTSTVSLSETGFYLYESDSSSTLGNAIASGSDFSVTGAGTTDGTKAAFVATFIDVSDDEAGVAAATADNLNWSGTKYFTLRGTISGHTGSSSDSESVQTSLAGDTGFLTTGSTLLNVPDAVTTVANTAKDRFLWSDLNFALVSTSATLNKGWFNGYRVPGLDQPSSTPQTISG